MSTYEIGTVAIADVSGRGESRVMRKANGHWAVANGGHVALDSEVSNVRPLVVLDLPNPGKAVEALKIAADDMEIGVAPLKAFWGRSIYRTIAHAIEVQTKPPRIAEPGPYGVVQAHTSNGIGLRTWVRMDSSWVSSDGVHHVAWGHLVDPILIREGMQA